MLLAFFYALGFLLIIPLVMGYEPLGIFGLVVGSICAWIVIGLAKWYELEKSEEISEDKEIIGTYVTEVRYYESWTEKIKHEDEETGEITYETIEHDEDWEAIVAEDGESIPIDEEQYREYVESFGNEEEEEADHDWEAEGEIIDPGYCHISTWPGTFETACLMYMERRYKNPALRADNVYASEKLDEDTIKKYHLTKCGELEIYGTARNNDEAWILSSQLMNYNCWFRDKNIKLNFILLENATSTQGVYWQQYWKNGKRNSINVVVGLTSELKIEWAHVFGWQNEATCIKLRNFIAGLSTLSDITENFNQIEEIIKEHYQLPNLNEYDFGQGWFPLKETVIALTICLGLFCGLFCRPPQYNERAQMYLEQKQYQLAKSNFQEHLSRVPDDVYALNNLGVIYGQEDNCEDAEQLFSRALENSYSFRSDIRGNIYLNRGLCYKKMKQNKNAISDMKKAIENEDYSTKNYCALYDLYKTLGYKKSIWVLQEQYNSHINGTLKQDCRDYDDTMVYLYDNVDMITGRGFMRLLRKIFS